MVEPDRIDPADLARAAGEVGLVYSPSARQALVGRRDGGCGACGGQPRPPRQITRVRPVVSEDSEGRTHFVVP